MTHAEQLIDLSVTENRVVTEYLDESGSEWRVHLVCEDDCTDMEVAS